MSRRGTANMRIRLAAIAGGVAFAKGDELLSCPHKDRGARQRAWVRGYVRQCVSVFQDYSEDFPLFHVDRIGQREGARWTRLEKRFLERAVIAGLPRHIAARVLQRSPAAARIKACRLRLTEKTL